jgi:hypothetical protein
VKAADETDEKGAKYIYHDFKRPLGASRKARGVKTYKISHRSGIIHQ